MNSNLFNSPLFNYALFRETNYTKDADINRMYDEISISEIIERFNSGKNIEYLVNEINILNGNNLDKQMVFVQVHKYIDSWINMGKFLDRPKTFNIINMLDYYNNLFLETFADTFSDYIIPNNIHQGPNLNGIVAQQTRYTNYKSKPIPFYEKALYKRHYDQNINSQTSTELGTLHYSYDNNKYHSELQKIYDDDALIKSNNYDETIMPIWSLKPSY
jgi:hypothetical protein